jgi:biopolymer transport protein TolQ
MSIVTWTLFLYRLTQLRIKIRQLQQAGAQCKAVTSLDQMVALTGRLAGTLPGYILSKSLHTFKGLLEKYKMRSELAGSAPHFEAVKEQMYHTIDDVMHREESHVLLFSTSAAVGPLLGLFGTTWGLVHAFMRISERQSADIITIAPGVAEALITTIAGLMVAVPALVMSSYINARLRTLDQQLTVFAEQWSGAMHTLLMM